MDKIVIKNARENNLKNINIEIPKNKLVVITGVSGSGKSSLAFDTIYKEGQRRYVESLSSYARQFLGNTEKANVDSIEGLSPSIAIDQKSTSKNPRSTVGTITEIYDYLRLLYARVGKAYCPYHNILIKKESLEEMKIKLIELYEGDRLEVLSPVIRNQRGNQKELFDSLIKSGFTKIKINDETFELTPELSINGRRNNSIDVVIDRLILNDESRLFEALEVASKLSGGNIKIYNLDKKETKTMSENYACPKCDFTLPEITPRLFSFNAPYGACDNCKGIGIKEYISEDLIMPDKTLSVNEGGIKGFNTEGNIYMTTLNTVANHFMIDLNKPLKDLKREDIKIILYGTDEELNFEYTSKSGNKRYTKDTFEGIINNLERRYLETKSTWIRDWIKTFMVESTCPTCNGARLKGEVLNIKVGTKNIYEITELSVKDIIKYINNLKLAKKDKEISELVISEIISRLNFLDNVGLTYLTLSRPSGTLSGGESQRIRLATQIGSQLTGVLYVLDEPSIGLHQRDNDRLINSLIKMKDLGNTLIVVEHDEDTMLKSDHLIDVGPGAGDSGGEIVSEGTPEEVMKSGSLTGDYLSGKLKIDVPDKRREGNGKFIEIKGAKENNLKNIDVKIPLGTFNVVSGVSGSGKSTLVNEILYKALGAKVYGRLEIPGKHKEIKGLDKIDKIIHITQDPIGRTPRSNPATYTGVFDEIRDVYANTKEAKIKGYNKGRFSFNVRGGRCEACRGDGVMKIEMHFLPDVYVKCDVCDGKRYNKETLSVKYKGKNIYDVLEMRVKEALEFFENHPRVINKLKVLDDVGLSYVKLGQSSLTLSGGEAGRVKLAKELQKRATGKSIFILDEPTTGLHTHDIKKLIKILNTIVDNGDTVLVIEHNLDVIKVADYIIDLGPEGGDMGGELVASGTPEEIIKVKKSYTGSYLKKKL